MSTRVWTRSHDALIARVAEGLEVKTWGEHVGAEFFRKNGDRPQSMLDEPGFATGPRSHEFDSIAEYKTDIAAGIRAAEAWVAQDRDYRAVNIRIFGEATVEITDYSSEAGSISEISHLIAEALAWALWKACGGVE